MAALNKAILIGYLGADPDIRYTPSGVAVASFSIATSETWKDKNSGEKKEHTEWHRITAFGKRAEVCGEYLAKGRQVYVEGRIRTEKWEDRDGVTRYTTKILADQVLFLGSGSGDGQARRYPQDDDIPPEYRSKPNGGPDDDDIPF